jgi:ribosomal protein L40E
MEEVESEVSDKSCLRKECHEVKRLERESFFRKGVVFNHKIHLEELKCTSCHDTDPKVHMALNTKICFDCHSVREEEVETCRACHTTLKETEELSHLDFLQEGLLCVDCHAGIHSF